MRANVHLGAESGAYCKTIKWYPATSTYMWCSYHYYYTMLFHPITKIHKLKVLYSACHRLLSILHLRSINKILSLGAGKGNRAICGVIAGEAGRRWQAEL